jgi:hypothetical protein
MLVDDFIATHYGEIPREKRIAIATTFELLWDKYGLGYAESATLRHHKP